jgi:hypothetical protein
VKKKKYARLVSPNFHIRRTAIAKARSMTIIVEPMNVKASIIDVNHATSKPWIASMTELSKESIIPFIIAITMKAKAPPNKIHKPMATDGRMVNSFN